MKNIGKYIIEKLRIDKDINVNSAKVFKKLKRITSIYLGAQAWYSKDFYTRVAAGDLFTVHFKCNINKEVLEKVWDYLYKEFRKEDLVEDERGPYIYEKTLSYKMKI